MKNLCMSCDRHWTREDVNDPLCRCRRRVAELIGGGELDFCSGYVPRAVIEREDDGTPRCSVCGALYKGWSVCPVCGADFRSKGFREKELTRVVTIQITQIRKGEIATELTDAERAEVIRYMEAHVKDALRGADDVRVSDVQEFVRG